MMKHISLRILLAVTVFSTAWKEINYTEAAAIGTPEANLHPRTANPADHANFSGEWKLDESKSERDVSFPICIFGVDHVRSKTMKIAEQAGFLTLNVADSGGEPYARKVKLIFDGKKNEAIAVGRPRETSAAKWSADGKALTVSSVRTLESYGENVDFQVTEAWTLIHDGKSLAVQVRVRSNADEHTMKLVYDKQ